MNYFDSSYISNSDLKKFKNRLNVDYEEPDNLEEIFELGTLIHAVLLEPHLADREHPKYELASKMAKTFMKDMLCMNLLMVHDFKREDEFYNEDVHGVQGRCKMDGSSKGLQTILEYKGLAVASEKAFDEAIMRFDYDQGAAWYLDVTGYKRLLIVGISKTHPDRIFKRIIDRSHKYYKSGEQKVIDAVKLFKMYVGV